ncbi:MAG TPA: ribonuclease D [Kiloniellales bacterium]|nr:ribonuclease D [Kiloniellales bacterium]
MTPITTTEGLAGLAARLTAAPYVALDTEFMRDQTYWPILCLVQIAGPQEAAVIDALSPGLDLAPLGPLLAAPETVKVFHAGRQDLEIFLRRFGEVPAPLFDTQVAAMVCGYGDQVAYDTLARRLAGASLDKASRFTDWSRRPLTDRQLAYAVADVVHLRPIYEKLSAELKRNGRQAWIAEEMAVLADPHTYDLSPERAWERLKSRSGDRKFLGNLKALAAWREREAQRRDVPRNRVVRDEQLFEIAAHRPSSTEELARGRGLSMDFARGRLGQGILAALSEAKPLAPEETPEREERVPQPGLQPLLELLKVLLKLKAEQHGVAQKLLANTADLEQLAADDRARVPALSGWRREVFGADALALKHGQLALTANGSAVNVLRLDDIAEPDA